MDKQWTKMDVTRVTTLTLSLRGVDVQPRENPQPATATTFRVGSLSATNAVSSIHQMGTGKRKDKEEG